MMAALVGGVHNLKAMAQPARGLFRGQLVGPFGVWEVARAAVGLGPASGAVQLASGNAQPLTVRTCRDGDRIAHIRQETDRNGNQGSS